MPKQPTASELASALAKLQWAKLSPEERTKRTAKAVKASAKTPRDPDQCAEAGKLGGAATAAKMTKKQRSERAKKAVQARIRKRRDAKIAELEAEIPKLKDAETIKEKKAELRKLRTERKDDGQPQ